MKVVGRLLSIKQLTKTPYRPSCNGLVERFNGTFNSLLRKLSEGKPTQWDRYIPLLRFCISRLRTGEYTFFPFQLLYGRQVRGSLSILRQLWTKEQGNEDVKNTYQYVVDFRDRLEETCKLVQSEIIKSSIRHKYYADLKKKGGKRKVQGMPQSQTAALPRHQEEEKTDKTKQVQIEQTYEKHQD